MAKLNIYTSNRMEVLADSLAEVLRVPLSCPFSREVVIIQSRGMEKWISMELAKRHGICANTYYPFPGVFIKDIFLSSLVNFQSNQYFDREITTWKIMKHLPFLAEAPEFEKIRGYLFADKDLNAAKLRLFQLSEKIAELFEQYQIFRPDMIRSWDKNKIATSDDELWQSKLWQTIYEGKEAVHLVTLRDHFFNLIKEQCINLKLPERISVFGVSSLSLFYLEIIAELSRLIDVHLFLLNPCREYWMDIRSDREITKKIEKINKSVDLYSLGEDLLHFEKGNSLLASLGTLGRQFFSSILELDGQMFDNFHETKETSLLELIQSDILNLVERGQSEKKTIKKTDRSIQVHSCHSPTREIEVLYDNLLRMFEEDPELMPKDILVMAPDIEKYAPIIRAVFESVPGEAKYKQIPFSIADTNLRKDVAAYDALVKILELSESRVGALEVMAILSMEHVRERFGISELDLHLIRRWIKESGIRWAIDDEHRGRFDLPKTTENTWKDGIRRLLLGYALPGNNERLYEGISPYDHIEGEEAQVLGRFMNFTGALFEKIGILKEARSLKEWSAVLHELVEEFYPLENEAGTRVGVPILLNKIKNLCNIQKLSGFDENVNLDVIKNYLIDAFKKEGLGFGFLTGGVTFCSMVPMRSLPFKVICLLGMNSEAFPRQSKRVGFDLMSKSPKIGDPSRRQDDRYLFLEAIISARQRLYISYVGQSIEDNSEIPPSVVVSDLLDYIETGFEVERDKIRQHVVVNHRLQPFNPVYFRENEKLFSYSEENYNAARYLLMPLWLGDFIPNPLPEADEENKVISISDLINFFKNPSKYLLKKRLLIDLEAKQEQLSEQESFELAALDKYSLEQEFLKRIISGRKTEEFFDILMASGRLPHGTVGEICYREMKAQIERFALTIKKYVKNGTSPTSIDIDIEIDDFRLIGFVDSVYDNGLVSFRFADLNAKDYIEIWIKHVILNAVRTSSSFNKSVHIGKDKEIVCRPIKDADTLLKSLLKFYWKGSVKPLRFFPQTSWTYAEAVIKKNKSREEALQVAQSVWLGDDFHRGEIADPYYDRCFFGSLVLDDEFCETAEAVFGSMIKLIDISHGRV